jgi:hypothetical protein
MKLVKSVSEGLFSCEDEVSKLLQKSVNIYQSTRCKLPEDLNLKKFVSIS